MKEKGYKRLIKDFDVDISCDGELWTSKEDDAEGFSLQIDIDYKPLSVRFYKQKGFAFKDGFCILPDVIKAVNERLEELTEKEEYIYNTLTLSPYSYDTITMPSVNYLQVQERRLQEIENAIKKLNERIDEIAGKEK